MIKAAALIGIWILAAIILISPGMGSFPDSDKDGVPDDKDKCPETQTIAVDPGGCSCDQKECQDDDNPCTAPCSVVNGKAICNTPEDKNTCGEERTCPQDSCRLGIWYDYPDQGHDYCLEGGCAAYECEPQKIPRPECQEKCEGGKSYSYDEKEGVLALNYACEAQNIIFEFVGPIKPDGYEIIQNNAEIKEQKIQDNKNLVVELEAADNIPSAPGKPFKIKMPGPPKTLKVDNTLLEPVKKGASAIAYALIAFIVVSIIILGSGTRMLYEYRKDKAKLRNFMERQLSKGYTATAIHDTLIRHGWNDKMIDKVFNQILRKIKK